MNMKFQVARLRFRLLRWLEKFFSVAGFYRLLRPNAWLRAAFKRSATARPLPAILGGGFVNFGTKKRRRDLAMNRALRVFSERLAEAKWRERCSFSGLEELLAAQQRGQPSIVAVCHFGPIYLLRAWLQAAGVRAASFVIGTEETRSPMDLLMDKNARFTDFPAVLHADRMREVMEFLAAGNTLIIAVDARAKKNIAIPAGGDVHFQMATGPLRLGAGTQARVFPAYILDDGRWHFHVKLCRPVPAELLAGAPDFQAAGKHILDELLPVFRAHPEQCTDSIINGFMVQSSAAG